MHSKKNFRFRRRKVLSTMYETVGLGGIICPPARVFADLPKYTTNVPNFALFPRVLHNRRMRKGYMTPESLGSGSPINS